MDYPVVKSRYEVIELLSEDIISYGYRGRVIDSHVPVQIWKYKADYIDTPLVKELIELADRVMSIQDDRVLKLIDYAYDGKYFYTIHESASTMQTLEQFLKDKAHWDLKTLWRVSTQLLSVMIKIEARRLVCGTLNLSGIYVLPGGQIKVARVALPIEILKRSWHRFSVVEDCIFYPPEFFQKQVYSFRSDIYSFGVLLYLFFSRKWPYDFSLKIDDLKRSLIEGPKPFVKIHPRVPDRVAAVVSRCLALDPSKRFGSFATLVKSYRGDLELAPLPPEENTSRVIQDGLEQELKHTVWKRYWRYIKVSLVSLTLLMLLLLGRHTYVTYLTAIPEISVPDVVGLAVEDAAVILEENQLSMIIVGTRAHPVYPEGAVVEMKPPAGRSVKQNRQIRLFLSRGAGPVLVPDLVGRDQASVMTVLDERGLAAEVLAEVYSVQYDQGIVIDQVPTPNTFITPSENIQLIISKGFPITIDIKKPRFAFFQDKDTMRRVVMTLYILEAWGQQDVVVYFVKDGQQEKLYSDIHSPGETVDLDFELETGGRIDIYFNNDRVFSENITDKLEERTIDDGSLTD